MEPAAVAMPMDQDRLSAGTMRAKPAMTMPKEAPASPSPISRPALTYSIRWVSATDIRARPSA